MKLDSKNSVFNMGDTSIRVKQIVEINKVLLNELGKHIEKGATWKSNKEEQENFYKNFIEEIVRVEEEENLELFADFRRLKNYEVPTQNKLGLRGRTLTNSLVKNGLINPERKLSIVGLNYLNENLKPADEIENLFELSIDNLIYFRQFLKLRIYSYNSDHYFYNFRFAIKFLSEYKNVPQNDFLTIIETIRPTQTENEISQLIVEYENVVNGNLIFEEYYEKHFANQLRSEEEIKRAKKMFKNEEFSDENFIYLFPNSKSNNTSLLYKDFVVSLIDFKKEKTKENLDILIALSKNNKIKKAFSSGKLPFVYKKHMSVNDFLDKNSESPLLSENNFDIYLEFVFSKHRDLIREYSDMCKRNFEITGLISFENGLVNLNNRWLFKPIIEELGNSFIIVGEDSYSDYEENDKSTWYQDISTEEILNIDSNKKRNIFNKIAKKFNTNDIKEIPNMILDKREEEYRDYIEKKFPKETIIKILEDIIDRNDENIFKEVTDTATVPTIYEYILTIAWYHLSKNKDYFLHKSFGVTLDGNKLPLIHKGGGSGDIEIISNSYSLLIEATLMDRNTQRRGELEPVIRHSINFALDHIKENTQTILIANELDNNVINIFRGTQFINLKGTLNNKKTIDGLNIFPFTTRELIKILEANKNDKEILECINNNINEDPHIIKNNWRSQTLKDLM